MGFATALSETSQLGMEMHVFNVQPQAGRADRRLDRRQRAVGAEVDISPPARSGDLHRHGLRGARRSARCRRLTRLSQPDIGRCRHADHVALARATARLCRPRSPRQCGLPFLGALDDELARYRRAAVVDHEQPIGEVGALELHDVSFEYVSESPVLASDQRHHRPTRSGRGGRSVRQRQVDAGAAVARAARRRHRAWCWPTGETSPCCPKPSGHARSPSFPSRRTSSPAPLPTTSASCAATSPRSDIDEAARLANLHDEVAGDCRWIRP